MPKLIDNKTGKEIEVSEGENLRESAEELGVPFGCRDGICGTCMIDIVSGEENLNELTEREKDLERDRKNRLACQCKIKQGEVRIEF
jgi:ferredoxin